MQRSLVFFKDYFLLQFLILSNSIICASWKDLPPISEDIVIIFITFGGEVLHIQAARPTISVYLAFFIPNVFP